jgi:hypothetical protein
MGFSQLSPFSGLTIEIHEPKHVFNDLRGCVHMPTGERPFAAHSYGRREYRFFEDCQFNWFKFPFGFQLSDGDRWLEDGLGFIFREEDEGTEHVLVRLSTRQSTRVAIGRLGGNGFAPCHHQRRR